MTEANKTTIMEIQPEDAANDICGSLSDILGRELTACEKHTMSIKAKYWFMVGMQKQNLIIQDKFATLVSTVK